MNPGWCTEQGLVLQRHIRHCEGSKLIAEKGSKLFFDCRVLEC